MKLRASGCRLKPACDELNISIRTYERWTKEGEVKKDQRPLVKRPIPKNKITEEERRDIIKTVNSPEYADLAPSQIVPKLADEGKYIASESTIYRVLKEEKMNTHRGRSSTPIKREIPTHIATALNQVWTWDITWLNAVIKGQSINTRKLINKHKIPAAEPLVKDSAYGDYLLFADYIQRLSNIQCFVEKKLSFKFNLQQLQLIHLKQILIYYVH